MVTACNLAKLRVCSGLLCVTKSWPRDLPTEQLHQALAEQAAAFWVWVRSSKTDGRRLMAGLGRNRRFQGIRFFVIAAAIVALSVLHHPCNSSSGSAGGHRTDWIKDYINEFESSS